MKNQPLFRTIWALAVALLLFAPGCGDDKTLCELIDGEWEVTSFRIDGNELIGNDIDEASFEFEANGCEGTYSTRTVSGSDEETDEGDYTIDEEDSIIEFDGDDNVYELKIEGDNLEMRFEDDDLGVEGILKAKRK